MPDILYLDANATTPVLPQAAEAAVHLLRGDFANPSSVHAPGQRARACLDAVRARAAEVLGAQDGRVVFTSGATEALQTAIVSVLAGVAARRRAGQACGSWLVYGATEHKAVPQALAHWNQVLGTELTLRALPVDAEGRHDLGVLRELAPQAELVCTMAVNNETGAVSDLAGIAAALRAAGSAPPWLVDGVQALGKLPLDLQGLAIDYAAFSGHKLYAPKGIGMLYVRAGAPYTPLIVGGGQEDGQRSGTENLPAIAALGAVLDALDDGVTFRRHDELVAMRDQLVDSLRAAFPRIVFNTPLDHAVPTTLNFSVPGDEGSALLQTFEAAGIAVSGGSACSAAQARPSHVLEAMGLAPWRTTGAVRLSFGPAESPHTIASACERIRRCAAAARDAASRAPSSPSAAAGTALTPSALAALLQQYPATRLVDVREPAEVAREAMLPAAARLVEAIPLGRVADHSAHWLKAPQAPVVFLCATGTRAARAAASLRAQGHAAAWHLQGTAAPVDGGVATSAT